MKTTSENAPEALEQAEKFRALRELVAEGLDDVAAGRVSEWDFQEFLRQARVD